MLYVVSFAGIDQQVYTRHYFTLDELIDDSTDLLPHYGKNTTRHIITRTSNDANLALEPKSVRVAGSYVVTCIPV